MQLAVSLLGYAPASFPWQADYAAALVPRLIERASFMGGRVCLLVTPLGRSHWEAQARAGAELAEVAGLDERKRRRFYAERYILPGMLRELGVDRVFAPLGGALLHPPEHEGARPRYVYRLQSLAYLNEPWRYSLLEQMFYSSVIPPSCRSADAVLTDHEALADDAARRGLAPRPRFRAVHPGVTFAEADASLPAGLEPGRYLFAAGDDATGALARRLTAICEHALLPPGWERARVVWCGRQLAGEPPRLGERVLWLPDCPAGQYRALLGHCAVALCLSDSESGLVPLRQALALGKPALAADTPAARSIALDSAHFASAQHSAEPASALASLLGSPELRAQLSSRALERARFFDWDNAAQAVLGLLAAALP